MLNLTVMLDIDDCTVTIETENVEDAIKAILRLRQGLDVQPDEPDYVADSGTPISDITIH